MADQALPLVRELPRQPGQHDPRWAHLLGPLPPAAIPEAAAVPAVDRDVVLRDGAAARDARVRAGYDQVAGGYAERFADELATKPFDRWVLDRVAELVGAGPVADVGCGPGHTTAHLTWAGLDAVGFDVAPAMVAEAQRRFPDVEFEVGDLRGLLRPPTASAWQAVVAWYALVHLAGSELPAALASLTRVLAPGGWLALALHVGDEVWHLDELCGETVDLDFVLHDQAEVLAAVTAAGLVDVEWYRRGPIGDAEPRTERLYVLARRAEYLG
jgi:SAM-dependent methyltransferase